MKEKITALKDSLEDMPEKFAEWRPKAGAFLKTWKGITSIVVAALVMLGLLGWGGYEIWLYQQPKFHDVTVELGNAAPELEAFLTEYANAEKVTAEQALSELELSKVGEYTLRFCHGNKWEEVVLTVEDTTAPEVKFQDVTINIGELLTAEDFVAEAEDHSGYTADFEYLEDGQERYQSEQVLVTVADKYGNETSNECTVRYRWLRETCEVEFGEKIDASALLYDPESDMDLLDPAWIEQVNNGGIGDYEFVSVLGEAECVCAVTVRDTTGPALELQDVKVYVGETAAVEDFVVAAQDISGDVTLRLAEELSFDVSGTYTVTVEAEDIYGNVTALQAELRVIGDEDPPEFYGVDTLYVDKHSEPAYYYGVSAVDARDGEVEFWVDDSRVDTSQAGTYYAVYYAEDKEGNQSNYRRQVVVYHDAEDTAALVSSIAAGLSSDPEEIRDYARNSIWYSHDWGGEDPVWFGLNQGHGNCYVHALVFQELLRAKGYETQLIWVTDQTHYWNLVKINGEWKHMDSTPSPNYHERYSIMTDATRYETLSGRDWDRTAWPAVE